MSGYRQLELKGQHLVKSLADLSGLDQRLVANIVQYGKCLLKDECNDIDEQIFTAQMIRQFNLSNTYMISSMYRALRCAVGRDVRLKDFCRCICIFLTSDLKLKAEFVFQVYDMNGDGEISYYELFIMVRTNVMVFDNEVSDDEENDPVKNLAEMAMNIMGINVDESITAARFRQIVEQDNLCLDILGKVLPTFQDCETFKNKIATLSTFQVYRLFEFERMNSLGEKKVSTSRYYPLMLALP